MLPDGSTDEVAYYAAPDQLRIGLYIHLDLPWFRHPFARNSFKISSEEQIRQLRALGLERFRYDPRRGDALAGGTALSSAAEGEARAPATAADAGAERSDRAPRARRLFEYRDAANWTERSFVKAVRMVRGLDQNLLLRPADALEEMGGLVEEMVEIFLAHPDVTLQVMGENCGGDEAYHHSLNVSVLCMMLVRGLELSGAEARLLGMGALLHDIGLIDIPDAIRRKSADAQTGPERDLRAYHVEFGLKRGEQLHLPPEVLAIIGQHHELTDGGGYPRGLKLDAIAPLARVVALVNFYDNLCNPVEFGQALTPHEALSHIFARCRDQFDARVLQIMIRTLGAYPPGTFVRLSNNAIAMVVSINQQKLRRPWVLLYDAAVPKEEATLLNLETQTDLAISRALKPAMLPVEVHSYLSPRRRITYFFDPGFGNSGRRE